MQTLSLSTGTIIRFLAIVGAVFVLYFVKEVIIALFFAIIIASAIEPAILWLGARKIPRILAAVVVYLAVLLVLFFVIYLVVPLLYEEIIRLGATYSVIKENVLLGIEEFSSFPALSAIADSFIEFLSVPSGLVTNISGGILGFASAAFGGALTAFLAAVFSFYLATQAGGIEEFLRLITPLTYEDYVVDLWKRSQRKLGRWLRTQMLLGAIVGILIFFALTFLGVENALLFAALAGLFEIIPVAGPILAAIPAVLTALIQDPMFALVIVLVYVAVQQIESNVIVPVVMRQTVGLSPLVVLIALALGAQLGGIIGILLAVPVTVVLAEFLSDWDKKKRELIPG